MCSSYVNHIIYMYSPIIPEYFTNTQTCTNNAVLLANAFTDPSPTFHQSNLKYTSIISILHTKLPVVTRMRSPAGQEIWIVCYNQVKILPLDES